MSLFAISISASVTLLGLAVLIQNSHHRYRTQLLQQLELIPNCLLTRHPIAFLAGEKSIFRIYDYWNSVPEFLREHGYEVYVIEPPRGGWTEIHSALNLIPCRSHLIGDSSHADLLNQVAHSGHEKVRSITQVYNPKRKSSTLNAKMNYPAKLRLEDLKPASLPIETFEVQADPTIKQDWPTRLNLLLLQVHNLFHVKKPRLSVDAVETGYLLSDWNIEKSFLRLAIELAEKDAQ